MFHYAALQSSIMSSVKLFILRDTELHRILEENILPKAMKRSGVRGDEQWKKYKLNVS